MVPAAAGEGGFLTSHQGGAPTEFPATLGLHPTSRRLPPLPGAIQGRFFFAKGQDALERNGDAGAGAAITETDANGQQRALDLNGDGVFNSEFDALPPIAQKLVSQLGALGISRVQIGIATFDSGLGFGTPNAPIGRPTDTDGDKISAACVDLSSSSIGTGGSGFAVYKTPIA